MSVAPLSPENPVNIVVPTGVSWKEKGKKYRLFSFDHLYKPSTLKAISVLHRGWEKSAAQATDS